MLENAYFVTILVYSVLSCYDDAAHTNPFSLKTQHLASIVSVPVIVHKQLVKSKESVAGTMPNGPIYSHFRAGWQKQGVGW